MARQKKLVTAAAMSVVAGMMVAMPAAQAANQSTVKANVPKPEAACGNVGTLPQGAWLANKPCGYIVGTALAGTRFDNHKNSSADFHYGRARGSGANFCAWIIPGALQGPAVTVADSCSSSTENAIVHRRTIGKEFDNEPHVGNGATTIPINASACTGYYNYFTDSTYQTGRLMDPVGTALPSNGAYRYSTNDGKAAMVRVGSGTAGTTWLFVDRACIASQLVGYPLSNTND